MTINERIKTLRKSMSLNQTDFGEKIGIKVSQASYIEKAGNPVSPRIIQLICNAFSVSEKWLLDGKGKMYTSNEDAVMEKVSKMYDLTPQQEIFARKWLQLPGDAREAVVEYVISLAESLKENQDTKKDESQDPSNQGTARPPAAETRTVPHDYSLTDDVTNVTGSLSKLTDGVKSLSKLTGKLPANCQQVNAPMPASCQPSTDSDKTRTGFGQDSDNSYNARPAGLSDKEWALVLMSREEEERGSLTSSSKKSERA